MSVFSGYASFYDDLYRDKDYATECIFLQKAFSRFGRRRIKRVLDLGCGTGSHDILLANKGYSVTGIDMSPHMLRIARAKAKREAVSVQYHRGNIQSKRLHSKFDAVISLFDVMGYQITNRAFTQALLTARYHLKPKGLFIFDCWFGPAVLIDPPRDRTKIVRYEKGGRISRQTTCRTDTVNQVVSLTFHSRIFRGRRMLQSDTEQHKVRFFFLNELHAFLALAGFRAEHICPFPRLSAPITDNDWKAAVICQKLQGSSFSPSRFRAQGWA